MSNEATPSVPGWTVVDGSDTDARNKGLKVWRATKRFDDHFKEVAAGSAAELQAACAATDLEVALRSAPKPKAA